MPTPTFRPGPSPRTVLAPDGRVLAVPGAWILVPPGDPGLTRRVKAAGDHWPVAEVVRNKLYSRGVWAPGDIVERIRAGLAEERGTEQHARRLEAGRARRERIQETYVADFEAAVRAFLRFPEVHAALAVRLAAAITRHATPVGSGTVARTGRIPVERRAEAAVIAWLRHQTTGYDSMRIERRRGRRREVRRELAQDSRARLDAYRRGEPSPVGCPLVAALEPPPPPSGASAQ